MSLYKKLELQNAIELLDTTMGDVSAAPSVVSLKYVTPPAVSPHSSLLCWFRQTPSGFPFR